MKKELEKFDADKMIGMTYSDIFSAVLPQTIAEKAIAELKGGTFSLNPTDTWKGLSRTPLSGSFRWRDSKNGGKYWENINDKYFPL